QPVPPSSRPEHHCDKARTDQETRGRLGHQGKLDNITVDRDSITSAGRGSEVDNVADSNLCDRIELIRVEVFPGCYDKLLVKECRASTKVLRIKGTIETLEYAGLKAAVPCHGRSSAKQEAANDVGPSSNHEFDGRYYRLSTRDSPPTTQVIHGSET